MEFRLGLVAAICIAVALPAAAETGRPIPERVQNRADVVLIFNHGTVRPQRQHECNPSRDVPGVVREVAEANGWTVHYLCSLATDGGLTGSYTYKRADEILGAVEQYRRQGLPARQIFLLGHSAGGWSSLMAARKDHSGFNAIVAFAPAFAGPRAEEEQYPVWRRQMQPLQIGYLTAASRIDALIFAYDDDAFDRPEDLEPLKRIRGIRIVAFNECQQGHRTVYTDCFHRRAREQVESYIKSRLARAQ